MMKSKFRLFIITIIAIISILQFMQYTSLAAPLEKPDIAGKCGDGICDEQERIRGLCPQDCVQDSAYAEIIDLFIPSESAGSPSGNLAVRLHVPEKEKTRYPEGAPIVVLGTGGFAADGLINDKLYHLDDMVVVTFIYPGGENLGQKRRSDGKYDYRGKKSIQALRDVILYCAGKQNDTEGKTIDDRVNFDVLHNNIGFIGFSNGGNIGVAVAALEGSRIADDLKYVIQWETPVSSQITNRDLGKLLFKPVERGGTGQADYFNPRYQSYGPLVLNVNYSDIAFDPESIYPVFLDGNCDGVYTTIKGSQYAHPVPDLNDDGILELDEDYGLDTLPYESYDIDGKVVYSRPVTQALVKCDIFPGTWPEKIATLEEANSYWDIRESVRLYENALENIPDLEGMFLLSVEDHVQSDPYKSHARQAFDGWHAYGSWIKINPSKSYIIEEDPRLADGSIDIPDLTANTPPEDWEDVRSYCIPEVVLDDVYQIAAVHQMADRVQSRKEDSLVTYIHSDEIDGNIAVRIDLPDTARYNEGAPIIIDTSQWFTSFAGFSREKWDFTELGAIYVCYLWPGKVDPETRARSDGKYDYGGPGSLAAFKDVIRFASGLEKDVDGHYLHELIDVKPLYDNVGIHASSHSGVMATNVLAFYGDELESVKYLVGRENPTIDEMYPLEFGHYDYEIRGPVYNPYYYPEGYTPKTVSVDYSKVDWIVNDDFPEGIPYFRGEKGEYVLSGKGPVIYGKKFFSRALIHALYDNGVFTMEDWPERLATPEMADEIWSYPTRTTVDNYQLLCNSSFKIMLVFAKDDHVQAAIDKPHIHQAYDGFRDAGLWVRMNPDRYYVQSVKEDFNAGFPDNLANSEPDDWMDIRDWAFPSQNDAVVRVSQAAAAEMMDRVWADDWSADLDGVMFEYEY
jgi:hypothetical protein